MKMGFRTFILFSGCLPLPVSLIVLPFFAILVGDLVFPNVLISDIMMLPTYRGFIFVSTCQNGFASTFIIYEYFRYIVNKAPHLLPAMSKMFIALVSMNPFLYLILGFDFVSVGDDDKVQDDAADRFEAENAQELWDNFGFAHKVEYVMHCIGATGLCAALLGVIVFWGIGVFPEKNIEVIENKGDVKRKVLLGAVAAVSIPLIGLIRAFHIMDRITWSVPLLVAEQWIGILCSSLPCMGFSGTMRELDELEPLLPCSVWTLFRFSNFPAEDEVHNKKEGVSNGTAHFHHGTEADEDLSALLDDMKTTHNQGNGHGNGHQPETSKKIQ